MRSSVDTRGKRGGMGTHHARVSDSDEWYTPAGIFEAVGLRYDLDPCAAASDAGGELPASRWCERQYRPPDDGLVLPWEGRVWMNPPYGRQTETWVRRLAAHGHGVALVFARTETAWWTETVIAASAVCFVAGRMTFLTEQGLPGRGNAGAPSALIAYGEDCARAVAESGLGMTFAVQSRTVAGQASLWEAG